MLKNIWTYYSHDQEKYMHREIYRFSEEILSKYEVNQGELERENTLCIVDDPSVGREWRRRGFAVLLIWDSETFATGISFVTDNLSECDCEFLEYVFCREKGISLVILESDCWQLMEIAVTDLPDLYELYQDEQIKKYIEPLYDYEEEKIYTEAYIQNMYGVFGFGLWVIRHKKTGELIGRAGIEIRNYHGKDVPELGYLVSEKYRKQGLAYGICSQIIQWAEKRMDVSELQIVTRKDNIPAIKLAQKLGFQFRDSYASERYNYSIFVYEK